MAWGYGYTAGHFNRNPNSQGSLAIKPNSNAQARWSGTPGHFPRNPQAEGSPGFGPRAAGPYITQPQAQFTNGNPNSGRRGGGGVVDLMDLFGELPTLPELPAINIGNLFGGMQQPRPAQIPNVNTQIGTGMQEFDLEQGLQELRGTTATPQYQQVPGVRVGGPQASKLEELFQAAISSQVDPAASAIGQQAREQQRDFTTTLNSTRAGAGMNQLNYLLGRQQAGNQQQMFGVNILSDLIRSLGMV